MKKLFVLGLMAGLLFGCAAIEEEESQTTLEPGEGRNDMFDPRRMQKSLMDSRQRRMNMRR